MSVWLWNLNNPKVLRRYRLIVYGTVGDFYTTIEVFNEHNEMRRRNNPYGYSNAYVQHCSHADGDDYIGVQERYFYFYDYRKLVREYINELRCRLNVPFELCVEVKGLWFDAGIDNEKFENGDHQDEIHPGTEDI